MVAYFADVSSYLGWDGLLVRIGSLLPMLVPCLQFIQRDLTGFMVRVESETDTHHTFRHTHVVFTSCTVAGSGFNPNHELCHITLNGLLQALDVTVDGW
jgi:hypothetical protein